MLPVTHYLFLSAALLGIGVIGAVIRRNVIVKLFSIELVFFAASINFMTFARLYGDSSGQIFAMVTMAIVALELLVALGMVAAVVRRWNSAAPVSEKDWSSRSGN